MSGLEQMLFERGEKDKIKDGGQKGAEVNAGMGEIPGSPRAEGVWRHSLML